MTRGGRVQGIILHKQSEKSLDLEGSEIRGHFLAKIVYILVCAMS